MKTIKKFVSLILSILTLISFLPCFTVQAAYKTPFNVSSKYAYMVNTDTDTVIFKKNENKKAYPASLTKIMTAVIAIEKVNDLEGTMIKAPGYIYDEFVGLGVSTADIRPMETVRMIDLLYALILPSSCEAGSIIADYVGGADGIPGFIKMMNNKAKELGAVNTHFINAHGLFDKEQVTTAKDMYLITKYALSLPIFAKICNTTTYKMPVTAYHPNNNWYINHTNKMLFKGSSSYYKDITGVKTGTLNESGRNLITTASKNGYNYILITLDAPLNDSNGKRFSENYSYTDAKNLYNWAFSSFSVQNVIKENEIIDEIKVKLSSHQDYVNLIAKNDVSTLLPINTDSSVIQRDITLANNVKAPIHKGDVLGKMKLKLSGEIIANVDLLAIENVDRSLWLYILDITSRFFEKTLVKVLFIILGFIVICYLIALSQYKRKKHIKAKRARKYRR